MDNKYDVTIPLYRYDELKETEFMYEDIIFELEHIIRKITRLNWNKTELDIQDEIIPLLKKYVYASYERQFEKLSKAGEKDDK